MKKEGISDFFISRNGKVNIMLLVSIVLVFLFTVLYTEALTITVNSPTNLSFNGSRNVNFTFTPTWSLDGENGTNGSNVNNCTIFVNTSASGAYSGNLTAVRTFGNVTSGSEGATATDTKVVNNSLSYANFTFSSDGNYTFNIGCIINNITVKYNLSGGDVGDANVKGNGTGNRTFFIDSVPPRIGPITPGGDFSTGGFLNSTSYGTAAFYINVSDNSTQAVWMVLYNVPSTVPISANESRGGDTNGNRSLTLNSTIEFDKKVYNFSLTGIMNFTSNFTGPGAHAVVFCANDTLGRVTCSAKKDWILMGGNITQIESVFSTLTQGAGGLAFGSMNMTLGNGTEIPESTFFNPITGVSVGGLTHLNFTFIFTFSTNAVIHIVGSRIDEGKLGNASNTRLNSTPTTEVENQVGQGYSSQLAWADIASFIPSEVSYEYGMLQLGGVGYSKKMYCNGTTMSDPQCHQINQCNATIFGIYNHTIVIPTNDACFLEALSTNNVIINDRNLSNAFPGFTFLFVDKFSGGLGGADFGPPNATFNLPRLDTGKNNTQNRSTTVTQFINFTVDDAGSTGVNLTANYTINVTITRGGSSTFFSYINSTGSTNITCTTPDTVSPGNTTTVNCNLTFGFNSNGTYLVNITARDDSNNSNPMNLTTSWFKLTVDQIPPVFSYYNFTNQSLISNGTTMSNNTDAAVQIGTTAGDSYDGGVSTLQGRTIYGIANWTDNLTQPLRGLLQFYNASSSTWSTLNETPADERITNRSSWTNFSLSIPIGHNEFEGRNVSFRIIANDTVGNANGSGFFSSGNVKNFTIQINDTTYATVVINGTISTNGTNISTTRPIISWYLNEPNSLTNINVSVDSTLPVAGIDGCKKSAFFDTSTGDNHVETGDGGRGWRNGSFQISSSVGCPLANGTHFVNITVVDFWKNRVVAGHTFTVQTGVDPVITLSGLESTGSGASSANAADNQSTVTSSTGINFSAVVGTSVTLRNISFTSSCNSTGGGLPQDANNNNLRNNTLIRPFQGSCSGATANRTITVTAVDSAGVSTVRLYQFLVDDIAPSLAVNAPTNGFSTANTSLVINLSAKDDVSNLSMFGYYLDNRPFVIINSSLSVGQDTRGTNISNAFNITLVPGTHTIKFTVGDAIGSVVNNTANSSLLTVTVLGNVTFTDVNSSAENYITAIFNTNLTNVSIRVKQGDGSYADITAPNATSTNTFEVLYQIDGRINVSLTEINGSDINWDKINFTPYVNNTNFTSKMVTNWTNTILNSTWFNTSINEFLQNNNSYYGVVVLPFNISGTTATAQEFWWIENVDVLTSRTNISQCTSAFTKTTTTPCWNYTANGKTIIQVPHFSAVVAVNDSSAPTINVTIPIANQTIGMFIPNITVSSDAATCRYQLNSSTPSNVTMTLSNRECIGQTERFKNLDIGTSGVGYNITFWVTDASGNTNQYRWGFNISDNTAPNNGEISSSPSTTTATVTITGANETVNATVLYGTANDSLSSTAIETDFNVTQSVSLSSLTASTTYYYNVTVCDYNRNCKGNGTFSFTTSAAAAAAAASTTSSTSAGGGGAAVASNEAASTSKKWDSLTAGTSAVLTINNEKIAVTGVIIDVKSAVSNPEIKVTSLVSNPLSAQASSKVYQYLQLTRTNIGDADTSKIAVNFKVAESWLTSNLVKEEDIVLYRHSDNKWNALATTKTGSDANNVLYQSITPGFSTFAIGVKEGAAPAEPAAIPTGEVPATVPTEPAPQEAPSGVAVPAQAAAPTPPVSRTAIAWIVVLIIVVAAGVGYYIWQKKKV